MRRAAVVLLLFACGEEGTSEPSPGELSGGAATVFDTGIDAYSHAVPMLERDDERTFFKGRALFRDGWVIAPSSTDTRDGLGPIFNARSCVACHARDGRGRPPDEGEDMLSMLIRLSIPGRTAEGAPISEPTYGGQMQPQAILGVAFEGRPRVAYRAIDGRYDDGEPYALWRPIYSFEALSFGPLHAELRFSPRVAPSIFGLGLLEAIPEETLQAIADPEDADGDGISGRINLVFDVASGAPAIGRFGWKANQPSLRQQTAGAFNGDIGITSRLFPREDCPEVQAECRGATSGGEPELIDAILDNVVFYTQALAVPARRDVEEEQVVRGERVFRELGCAACHVPELVTGPHPDVPELGGQTIHPYSDLLLHDLGDELADGREDFEASGREWRTPPLWGIGLQATVSEHSFLLHDGRARGLEEAILWHGGEAEAAKLAFVALAADQRAELVRFLESL
jgi:CxxC motif-containing protein (DUF1111 family)